MRALLPGARGLLSAQLRFKTGSSRTVARGATEARTITNEAQLKQPWAQPGWKDAYVSSQPLQVQAGIIAGLTAVGAALTYLTYTAAGPWVCSNVPLMDDYMSTAPFVIGPLFILAGITHFTSHEIFCRFYPHQGAWGFWYLPGSPSFHVNWTGIAEVLGGAGLVLGALHLPFLPDWLLSASAFGVFFLLVAVSPSNIYMWSHNAPGPGPEEAQSQASHVFRGFLQVVLLSTFLGIALHNY